MSETARKAMAFAASIDVLSRPLLESYHPLAIAKLLCSDRQFVGLAGDCLRAARHRPSAIESETEQFWRVARQGALENFLEQVGFDSKQLLRPPMPADETCLAYCPCCLAQFTTRSGTCEDCGGLTLESFSEANSNR